MTFPFQDLNANTSHVWENQALKCVTCSWDKCRLSDRASSNPEQLVNEVKGIYAGLVMVEKELGWEEG